MAYPRTLFARRLIILLPVAIALAYSANRVDIGHLFATTGQAAVSAMSIYDGSLPLQLSARDEAPVNCQSSRADAFSSIERELVQEHVLSETTTADQPATVRCWRVERFGYVGQVVFKMLETLEIALWGTIVAIVLGMPLALLGTMTVTRSSLGRALARGASAALRAVPELISALFLVLVYGFGPAAGILALGLHAAGFLGRFYADAMEDIARGPVEAIRALGATRLAIWRIAVLPQAYPALVSSTAYVFDRNVRMATVIGLVGAGGIGQELKGRFDMYQYGHVGTILLAILATVLLLDVLSHRLRNKSLSL